MVTLTNGDSGQTAVHPDFTVSGEKETATKGN